MAGRNTSGAVILACLRMARPDHWFKNIFMLPGLLLAFYFRPELWQALRTGPILLGVLAACLVASSNYVLNEILDAETDRHPPEKRLRAMAAAAVGVRAAYAWWALLAAAGLALGFLVSPPFALWALLLWLMGLIYNVPPVRSKDRTYLDVLSEAVNNPIRLAMGWYASGLREAPPPLSVIVAYWMFGCFLMAVKRFAEYNHIGDAGRAANYRASFAHYTRERLLESIMFYASLFAMMSGVFITRYRFELVAATPLVAYCMAYYLHLGFKPDSPVQYPERLFRQKKLMALVSLTFLVCAVLLFVDLPALGDAFRPLILAE